MKFLYYTSRVGIMDDDISDFIQRYPNVSQAIILSKQSLMFGPYV
jgi:hypothetical protein